MNDDKLPNPDATQPPPRAPNREFRRRAPVIEGDASPVRADPASPEPASPEPASPEPVNTPPAPTDAGAESAPPSAESTRLDTETRESTETASGSAHEATAAEQAAETPSAAPMQTNPPPPDAADGSPRSPGYGIGALAAASLASAGLAALAVFGVQTLNAPAGPNPSALEARIAEIDSRLAANVQGVQVSPAEIAALEKRVASVEALASEAAAAARKAADAASRPAPGAETPDLSQQALDSLGDRVAAMEKSATGASSNLDERIVAIEQALAAPKAEDRANETRVEPAPPTDIEPLREQLAALETRLQTIESQTAPLAEGARAADTRFKNLEERIQPLAGRIDEARAQDEAARQRAAALAEHSADAARIALAQSVSAALATGAPFATQVQALDRLGAPSERLAPLTDALKSGVPTTNELERALGALRAAIVAPVEAPANSSVVDRLTNSALGLVRVRPAGETQGNAPADIFARMMEALKRGDVAAALKEREALPEQGKAASALWAKRAQTRLDAEQAAQALLSDLTQKLGRN